MPCDRKLKTGETITQRVATIRDAVEKLAASLATGKVRPVIGPTGAIAFQGWSDSERNGVTDNCAYARLLATGPALAKQAIARAEQLSGRTVNRQAVAHGHHAHSDGHGGLTWHTHKG